MPTWATFPNPVNDLAARVVAGGVALLTVVTIMTDSQGLILLLALGFAARSLAGPRFSLLGRLATEVVAPRLGMPRFVPGPPKRFAQMIGLVLTVAAAVLSLALDAPVAASALLVVLLLFALLESALGFCAGCWLFGQLMRLGLVSRETCEECASVCARYGRSTS